MPRGVSEWVQCQYLCLKVLGQPCHHGCGVLQDNGGACAVPVYVGCVHPVPSSAGPHIYKGSLHRFTLIYRPQRVAGLFCFRFVFGLELCPVLKPEIATKSITTKIFHFYFIEY